MQEGSGKQPTAADTVEVHYEGWLIDGTVFDSSYKRGQTISFPLGGVIPGWTEGLQLMPVGSKYQLVIPPLVEFTESLLVGLGAEKVLELEALDLG